MRLICVTGMPGCGKEEFAKVAEENGIKVIRMGDVVRAEAEKRGLEFSDGNVGGLANSERHDLGYDIWAERTLPLLSGDVVIVEGIRCPQEIEVFRNKVGQAELEIVAIHSSPATRRKRLMQRARRDDVISDEEFAERDRRELDWGICSVIAVADHMIVNEGTLEDLRKKTLEFLRATELIKDQ
jgi:dephospho-CoA kinase